MIEFNYQLVLSEKEGEGVLLVKKKMRNKFNDFYVSIVSFERTDQLHKELLNSEQKYSFEKRILKVRSFSEPIINNIIEELIDSGDFFEIMQPLNSARGFLVKLQLLFKHKLKKYKNERI